MLVFEGADLLELVLRVVLPLVCAPSGLGITTVIPNGRLGSSNCRVRSHGSLGSFLPGRPTLSDIRGGESQQLGASLRLFGCIGQCWDLVSRRSMHIPDP